MVYDVDSSTIFSSFFFDDTAPTEIYTLSLHDALPISEEPMHNESGHSVATNNHAVLIAGDRKSTRLNSSHGYISYAVFCLKKKKHSDHSLHDRRDEAYEGHVLDRDSAGNGCHLHSHRR